MVETVVEAVEYTSEDISGELLSVVSSPTPKMQVPQCLAQQRCSPALPARCHKVFPLRPSSRRAYKPCRAQGSSRDLADYCEVALDSGEKFTQSFWGGN